MGISYFSFDRKDIKFNYSEYHVLFCFWWLQGIKAFDATWGQEIGSEAEHATLAFWSPDAESDYWKRI